MLHVFFCLFVFPFLDKNPPILIFCTEHFFIYSHGQQVFEPLLRNHDFCAVVLRQLNEDFFFAEIIGGDVDIARLVAVDDVDYILDAFVLYHRKLLSSEIGRLDRSKCCRELAHQSELI